MKGKEAFDVMDYLNTGDKQYSIEDLIRIMHSKTTKCDLTVALSYKADSLTGAPWTAFAYEMDWGTAEETIKAETKKIHDLLESINQVALLHKDGDDTIPESLEKYLSPINNEEKEIIINKVGEDVFSWSEERMEQVEEDIECRDRAFAYRIEFIPNDETTEENRKNFEEQLASEERLNDIKTLFAFRNAMGELRLGEGPLAYELLRRVQRYYTLLTIGVPDAILDEMMDKEEKLIAEAVVYHDIAEDTIGWQAAGDPEGEVWFNICLDDELGETLCSEFVMHFYWDDRDTE